MPRKHLVASQTNKKQQDNARVWQKVAREIKAAAKTGGTNPEANPRLKAAIDRALQVNLSRDSINRNINGAQKDDENLTQNDYEIYGPNGLAIVVRALTDNPNRTLSSLNGYISKLHGNLARPNAVKINFEWRGIILTNTNDHDLDQVIEMLLEDNIIDVQADADGYEIIVAPDAYYVVKQKLVDKGFVISYSELKLEPLSEVTLDPEDRERFKRFCLQCEEDDDVQWVVANAAAVEDN